jgi:hypothetical protein
MGTMRFQIFDHSEHASHFGLSFTQQKNKLHIFLFSVLPSSYCVSFRHTRLNSGAAIDLLGTTSFFQHIRFEPAFSTLRDFMRFEVSSAFAVYDTIVNCGVVEMFV